MNPKVYSQHSRLIQWAYLFEEVRPLQTSTCALFWRSVLVTPVRILGPVMLGGLLLFIAFTVLANNFAHAWVDATLPTWMHAKAAHDVAQGTGTPFPWWVFGAGACFIASFVLAAYAGVFTYIHSFCLPVEIEGGLVRQGSCPRCGGMMVEDDEQDWSCRKCGGVFLPPGSPSFNSTEAPAEA